MIEIRLEKMTFYAHHGFFDDERKVGGRYEVTLSYGLNADRAESDDDIEGTVNYQEIYDVVAEEMSKPSKLIENVARRIVDSVCSHFDKVEYAEIELSKINPPITGQVERATVKIKKFKRTK